MAQLNRDAMKKRQEKELKGNNTSVLKQKDLTEETIVRFLPAAEQLNGVPELEVTTVWIENKPFISDLTFGRPCKLMEAIEEARNSDDEGVQELLADDKKFKVDTSFWLPILHLQEKGDDFVVVDNRAKMLTITSKPLLNAIYDVMASRAAQNKTADGMMDRVKGWNTELCRKKTGPRNVDVEYKATMAEQWEAPAKYYGENMLNAWEEAKAQRKNPKYAVACLYKYLYGEPIPAALEAEEKARQEKRKAEAQAKSGATRSTRASDDNDTEVRRKPKARPAAEEETVRKPKRRPVQEEEDYEDDLDTALEEKPAKKSGVAKPVRKQKPEPEDDIEDTEDETAEEEEVRKPVKKSVKPQQQSKEKEVAPKKARNIEDDFDIDDEDEDTEEEEEDEDFDD